MTLKRSVFRAQDKMQRQEVITQQSWHSLEILWEGDKEVIEQGLSHEALAPPWQILILGDFSPTRHFRLLTGEKPRVVVINMLQIGMDTDGVPDVIKDVPAPRLRRQVWLCSNSGQRLCYAVSWWQASHVEEYLQNMSMPIWENLSRLRTELYRDIFRVQYGHSPVLEKAFGCEGPFWSRYYLFYHNKKPLTLIYEVFSPYLEKYVGKSRSSVYLT